MHGPWGIDSSLKQKSLSLCSCKDTWQASLFLKSVSLKANSHFPSLPGSTTEYPDQNTHIKSNMHLHARPLTIVLALKCLWSWVALGD